MALEEFRLPDLGEGLTEGDILKWTVAVGDTVAVNQTIAEVETVKAAVELPSPFAGVVTALLAREGQTVPVGTPLISIETAAAASAVKPMTDAPNTQESKVEKSNDNESNAADSTDQSDAAADAPQLLVGYGPRDTAPRRRRRGASRPTAAPGRPDVGAHLAANLPPRPGNGVLAKPPVRKLAKTLGVDLAGIAATGPNGTISREDVEAAAAPHSAATNGTTALPNKGDRETRVPIAGIRKHTAEAMVRSAFTAPHVTEFLSCDVTATIELRDRVAARPEFADVKVSPLLFVAKAVILAARNTPEINATWDEAAGEIVYKHYVNLGIAAATERGLIVPNIKDADRLSLLDLARAIKRLTETARAGRTTPADMLHGTITITNVGVFGIDAGTPILNPGESGIVAFGAISRRPWVVGSGADERIEPRWVTQLAVSFDHRLVDGAQGSRFLSDVAAILADPGLALL